MSLNSLEQAIDSSVPILLDSSVLISYFKGDEQVSPVADHLIDEWVIQGRNGASVSTFTLMELLVGSMQTGNNLLYRQIVSFFMQTLNLHVAPVDFRVAHAAATIRATLGLKVADALIMATGTTSGAHLLVSNDEEWKRRTRQVADSGLQVCYLRDHLPFP